MFFFSGVGSIRLLGSLGDVKKSYEGNCTFDPDLGDELCEHVPASNSVLILVYAILWILSRSAKKQSSSADPFCRLYASGIVYNACPAWDAHYEKNAEMGSVLPWEFHNASWLLENYRYQIFPAAF